MYQKSSILVSLPSSFGTPPNPQGPQDKVYDLEVKVPTQNQE